MQAIRKVQGLSAKELSGRCAELGYPIPRNTITNLENGRKEVVSIQEVAVLARALDVPPVVLLFAAHPHEWVDVLPGVAREAFEGIQWFSGEWALLPDPGLAAFGSYNRWASHNQTDSQRFLEGAGSLYIERAHASMLNDLTAAIDRWAEIEVVIEDIERGDIPESAPGSALDQVYSEPIEVHRARSKAIQAQVEQIEAAIVALRNDMRKQGVTPPVLHGELSRLDRYPAADRTGLSAYERRVARLDPFQTFQDFGIGTRVTHARFGVGRVVGFRISTSAEGEEKENLRFSVKFDGSEETQEFDQAAVLAGTIRVTDGDDGVDHEAS